MSPTTRPTLADLLAIMARLRDPERGCPWDLAQDFASIVPYTIEEAYEVADAVARGDRGALRDELGDLLLQVVFHSRMAEERGWFDFADVVAAICAKLIRRHPHVFAEAPAGDAAAVHARWEEIKRAERGAESEGSLLDGIAPGLPEWQRAAKLHHRAASVGFDWPDVGAIRAKLDEELAELDRAGGDRAAMLEEFGDVLFVLSNLARHLQLDPGAALRAANRKFERRFRRMEALARARGLRLEALDLAAQDRLWEEDKAAERSAGPAPDRERVGSDRGGGTPVTDV